MAHADPASDWPAALLAANARVVCRGSARRARHRRHASFFLDTFTTAIEPTEVLTEIRFGRRPEAPGRRATSSSSGSVGDFATAGVATVVRLGDGGAIGLAGIGVTGVRLRRSRRPMRKPSSSASGRRTRCSERPPRRPPRWRARRRTFAVPSTTSGRWSPSSPFGRCARAVERALAYA